MQRKRRDRARSPRHNEPVPRADEIVLIERIGHQGDGIGQTDDGSVFVPFTVPGDRIRISRAGNRGVVREIIEPGPDRQTPLCPHFGACGGCGLQHVTGSAYVHWKRQKVRDALAHQGLGDVPIAALIESSPHTRRRTRVTAVRQGRTFRIGYNRRASHQVFALESCPVVEPEIETLFGRLKPLIECLGDGVGRLLISLTNTDTGMDILVTCDPSDDRDLSWQQRAQVSAWAEQVDAARLTFGQEVLIERRAPVVRFSGVNVCPPPGAFLQASCDMERALVDLLRHGVADARSVGDLFAGCGTLTFALAHRARIWAVEGNAAMVGALKSAASRAQGLKSVTTEHRDLFQQPLLAAELDRFDAVVFDPPRAGAAAQAAELAKSSVPRVVGVSCHPASFARDARILCDAGFRLDRVTPIDQFLWSAQIELVGVFSRP